MKLKFWQWLLIILFVVISIATVIVALTGTVSYGMAFLLSMVPLIYLIDGNIGERFVAVVALLIIWGIAYTVEYEAKNCRTPKFPNQSIVKIKGMDEPLLVQMNFGCSMNAPVYRVTNKFGQTYELNEDSLEN